MTSESRDLKSHVQAALAAANGYSSADLRAWAEGLTRWGSLVCLRAASAACRVSATAQFQMSAEQSVRYRAALAAVEDWVSCPCEMHEQLARTTALAVERGSLSGLLTASYFAVFATSMASVRGQCCSTAALSVELAGSCVGIREVLQEVAEDLLDLADGWERKAGG